MAGLLDYQPDPIGMGLLGMGASLMTPRAMGGGVGPAMMAFNQQALAAQQLKRQAEQDGLQRKLFDLRLLEAQDTAEDRKRRRAQEEALQQAARDAFVPASPGSLGGGVAPGSQQGQMLLGQASGDPEFDRVMLASTNAALNTVGPQQSVSAPTAGGFDKRKYMNALYGLGMPGEAMRIEESLQKGGPLSMLGKIDPKDYTRESFAAFMQSGDPSALDPVRKREFVDGVAVDPYATPPGQVVSNPLKIAQENIIPDGQGGFMVNPLAVQARERIARAGATQIGLPKIEVKMGDSVGGQIGPMLKDSATAVGGAVKMADAADRILTAVDQGGVIAGPGASLRLKGAQVASMLGIGGKDAVAQTRQVIRGLAESSVEARKELAGQGQVTENEAKAVDKALSGNIDDLTVEEIRDIARLNLRHATMRARQHQQYLTSMPESLAPARPFYTVPGMDRLLNMDPARYEMPKAPTQQQSYREGQTATGPQGRRIIFKGGKWQPL